MLKKICLKCFLGLVILICVSYPLPFAVLAANASIIDGSPSVELKPIVISAVRSVVFGGRVAENAAVVSKNRIKALPARDLGEVLGYVSGIDMSVGTGFGQATSLSIHGSNSRDVLVMVDDIPFNTQISGQASPTRIPIENVERVEVIKGAASSAWGSSMGGVINVITKDTGESAIPTGHVTNSFGAYVTRKHSMDMAGKAGDIGYYFMDSFMDTDGTRFQSPVREQKSFAKVSVPVGDMGKLTGSFGYSGARVRQYVFSTNRINESPYIARYGKLKLDLDRLDGNVNLAYKYNGQEAATDTYNATTNARVSTSANRNEYQGVSVNGYTRVREDDTLVMGADLDWQTIKSSNYLKTAKSVKTQAPYANYTLKLGLWDIVPGLRFDNNDTFGNQLSPSVGGIYHFSRENDTQWRLKASRAFTAPPLMWIYNDDPSLFVAPNLDLKAERAMVYETGATADLGKVRMDINLYRSDIKDGLSTVFVSGLSAYQKQNMGKLRREGVEAQVDYKVSDALKMYVSGGYHHPVNRVTRDVVRGNGVALQSFGGGVIYRTSRGLGIDLFGHYDRWDSPASAANDRKPIFDLKLTKNWKSLYRGLDLDIFFSIYNLTHSKYWTTSSAPLPERYFEGGATVSF